MKLKQTEPIEINFDGKKCIHARRCVLGLPRVFKPGVPGTWIHSENAEPDEIAEIINSCPSGALSYTVSDVAKSERNPEVNTVRLWENGPLEFKGDLMISGQLGSKRRVLCRCGNSKNKPYCDNSHRESEFVATSDVPSVTAADLERRDGVLDITPVENGPLMVLGNLEVIAGSGRRITAGEKYFLCRCGASKNKPFCDGSHVQIGFKTTSTND